MMTCRLLCALLVLALCCSPSVCGTTSEDPAGKSVSKVDEEGGPGKGTEEPKQVTDPAAESPGKIEGSDAQGAPGGGQALPQHPSKVAAPAGSPGPTSTVSITKEGSGRSGISGSPGPVADTAQENGDSDTTESKSGNNPSTDQTNTNADDSAQKMTTTTTTTTTQALSTTTTEAPTTTTTRAPSRLRKIDGSLSSSAWVCAPLVLAVSALAYTTLG
ncbi:putative mucin TcMUCII [Trypanosoma cruzi]|nr:putative mucin TcMUCII [Trypanosoma cruzi]